MLLVNLPNEDFSCLWYSAGVVFEDPLPYTLDISFKISAPIQLTNIKFKRLSISRRHLGSNLQRVFTNKCPLMGVKET